MLFVGILIAHAPQMGEQDHFPDAAAACEEHDQPVHADSKTTGRGAFHS